MTTRRERVMKALSFEETDRVPMDLDGMASTGISCFAYPDLVAALGLPPRRPRVYDTGQMLAMPELDVLDALDCDVVTVHGDVTNAFEQDGVWRPYDFNGRLPALVRDPAMFQVEPDGTITQPAHGCKMPPTSHVFEAEHGGQPFPLTGDIPKPDLAAIRKHQAENPIRDEEVARYREVCRRAREASDRAVFLNGPGAGIGVAGFGGIAIFPMLCLTEPDFVRELHDVVIDHAIQRIRAVAEATAPYIDIYIVSSDDWGTQAQTICPPSVYEGLFLPYYRRVNDAIHEAAPQAKTFLHSCGAIYDILDLVADSGFDVVNPVQWTAGGHSYREWKDRCRNRIALWGGGVNAQQTLVLGSVADVEREVAEIVPYMRRGGGYVFNSIHNILAEVPGDKVVAMYRAAASV